MRIGIIGGPNVVHKDKKVKELLFRIRQEYGSLATIVSGGNPSGIEQSVKDFVLEFGMPYVEFNPSFSGHNEYSAELPEYFSKKWHFSHYADRYKRMLWNIDKLVVCIEDGVKDTVIQQTLKLAEKSKVHTVLI